MSIMILGCAGTGPCYLILHVGPEWSDKVKELITRCCAAERCGRARVAGTSLRGRTASA